MLSPSRRASTPSWPWPPRSPSLPSSWASSSLLDHVLWIGGAPGAGKSTAAWLLAHRHDLRLYPVDASAHAHGAPSRGPTMRWFNALPLDQRFERSPAALADEFLAYSREQFELVLEDLDTYPDGDAVRVGPCRAASTGRPGGHAARPERADQQEPRGRRSTAIPLRLRVRAERLHGAGRADTHRVRHV